MTGMVPTQGSTSVRAMVAAALPVVKGQTRVHPEYPRMTITVRERVGERWRCEYRDGGWVVLDESVVRANYPLTVKPSGVR